MNIPESLLSDKQIQFIARSNKRQNIADGAVRSGKTFSSLLRWLMYVAKAPAGELLVTGRTSHTIFRNVFRPLMDEALFGDIARLNSYTAGAPTGKILGRTVHIVGFNDARAETKLRGFTCAGAYADELTLASRDFYGQLLARMSVPGAKLFGTTNPDNPNHWLMKQFLAREDELDLYRCVFTLDDNPSLTDEYKSALKSEFTGLMYQRFVLGQWVQAEGAVYDSWDKDSMVIPLSQKIPPIIRWLSIGVDYGTTNPFAAILLGMGVDGVLYAVDEYRYSSKEHHKSKTDAEYSADLRKWIDNGIQLNGKTLKFSAPPCRVDIDPSAKSFREQLFRDKFVAHRADNEVDNGIRNVATLLTAGKLKISERCKGIVEEMPAYSWDAKKTDQGLDQVIKLFDHSLDALRYAVHTSRHTWAPKLGLTSVVV